MGKLLGEPFQKYVNDQIIVRQKIHGKENRTIEDIAYLNSRNAWVKLASGVSLNQERLDLLKKNNPGGSFLLEDIPPGKGLAQQYVLFNGLSDGYKKFSDTDVSRLSGEWDENLSLLQRQLELSDWENSSGVLNQRSGIEGSSRAYGVGGTDFGYSPMPGIISADVRAINRGSLKKATIQIKAHNKQQFDIIDALYLRLGFSVFLEWGYDKYFTNATSKDGEDYEPFLENSTVSLIDRKFFDDAFDNTNYRKWLPIIEKERERTFGNYDAIFGTISNFSWTFNPDGSYSIKMEIMSLGDVIESLKVNMPPMGKVDSPYKNAARAAQQELFGENAASIDAFYQSLYPGLGELLDQYWEDSQNNNDHIKVEVKRNEFLDYSADGAAAIIVEFDKIITVGNLPKYEGRDEELTKRVNQFLKYSIEDSIAGAEDGYYNAKYGGDLDDRKFKPISWDIKSEINNVELQIQDGSDLNKYGQQDVPDYVVNPDAYVLPDDIDLSQFNNLQNDEENNDDVVSSTDAEGVDITEVTDWDKMIDDGQWYYESAGTVKWVNGDGSRSVSWAMFGMNDYPWSPSQPENGTYTRVDGDVATIGITDEFDNRVDSPSTDFYSLVLTKETFRQGVFEAFKEKNLAGGETDDLFKSDDTEEDADSVESQQQTIRENKDKNRIFRYFYDIRNFGLKQEKRQYTVWTYNKKITAYDTRIGKILNPKGGKRETTKAIQTFWFNVGFPEYKQKNWSYNKIDIISLDSIAPSKDFFYIRFGTFCEFLNERVIPYILSPSGKGAPIIEIDNIEENNLCYTIDNIISSDIRKLIVKNDSFFNGGGYDKIFPQLESFKNSANGYLYGKTMNVYFNLNRIEEILGGVDSKGNVSIFDLLKSMCDDINSCLGDVNNIEPVIDKDQNIIKFVDQTPIPNINAIAFDLGIDFSPRDEAVLEVFGYNPDKNQSNFIHKIGITTEINKKYATMITIGATSNGSVPGIEATAFSRWNVGIEDRFKNKVADAANRKDNLTTQNQPTISVYKDFAGSFWEKLGLNQKEGDTFAVNDTYIDLNKSTIKDYYVYAQAKISSEEDGEIESSIGFLPFNLKIEMDGLGGMKIYNRVTVNTSFLPSNYPNTLDFIITGVDHKLQKNKWVTSLKTLATTRSKKDKKGKIIETPKLLGNFSPKKRSTSPTPDRSDANPENSGTLGTTSTPITNIRAYKTPEELESAIKIGIDLIDAHEKNTELKPLRKRILRVAASFVGQTTYGERDGFDNETMEALYREVGWKPDRHYCNYSVNLFWFLAFTRGNSYVQPLSGYENDWEATKRKTDIGYKPPKVTAIKENYYSGWSKDPAVNQRYGMLNPNCGYTAKNFEGIDKYVHINGKKDTLKTAIDKHSILPGDCILFDWDREWVTGKGGITEREDHIGIYLGPADDEGKYVYTLEGNTGTSLNGGTSAKKGNGIGKRKRGYKNIDGFAQLFTNNTLNI